MRDDQASPSPDPGAAPHPPMNVDPDAPPAKPNEDQPSPQPPLKDQGDPLSARKTGC